MRQRRVPLIAALFAVFALSAGCGARLDDDQYAAAVGGGNGGGGDSSQTAGRQTGTVSGVNPGTNTGTTGTDTGGGLVGGTEGTSGTAGSGGSGGGGGGSTCTAVAGTTGPGISDTEIKFGNVSTITGAVPGFGETGRSGAKAYFDFINATEGGVCGRQLTLVNADDRLDASANRSATEQLKDQVFGFVGSTTVVDNGGASILSGTNIPVCSLTIGDQAAAMPNSYSPNPINVAANTNGSVAMWEYLKGAYGITKVAIVNPKQNDARARALAYVNDAQQAGLATETFEVEITETNYTGLVTSMASRGADALITTLEVNGMAKLAQAVKANPTFSQQLKVPFYGAQAYGQQFIDSAGSAADGTIIGINYDIIEGGVAATQEFAEWFARSSPGKKPDFFAIMGWTGAKLCAAGLRAAGGAPTRDAAIAALDGMNAYTADGQLTPRDPAGKSIGREFVIVGVQGGQWTRIYPTSGFAPG